MERSTVCLLYSHFKLIPMYSFASQSSDMVYFFFQCMEQMLCIIEGCVLDGKVIHYEGKDGVSGLMLP